MEQDKSVYQSGLSFEQSSIMDLNGSNIKQRQIEINQPKAKQSLQNQCQKQNNCLLAQLQDVSGEQDKQEQQMEKQAVLLVEDIKKNYKGQGLQEYKKSLNKAIEDKLREFAILRKKEQAQKNKFVTQEQFKMVSTKYRKYKDLYRGELQTSKKLKTQLRTIYDKVIKLEVK